MTSMPYADPASAHGLSSRLGRAFGLLAALAALASPGVARAETPQGYTGDVTATPPGEQPTGGDGYADTDPSALTDFQDQLSPYGSWVQDPTYGTVWVPNSRSVGSDFAPYQSAGHWATDDNGEWMWVSDYAWGDIPFHYGRWVWGGSEWEWIPGREYAPAWVTWRVGDGDYLGWAPMPPSYYWNDGVAVGLWTVPFAAYCFCPTGYVFYGNVSSYVVRDRAVVARAAAATHPYRPATPTVRNGAMGGGGSLGRHPASPTLAEAHVSPAAAASAHASPNPHAMAYATRSSTATLRGTATASRGNYQASTAARPNGWNNNYDRPRSAAPAARQGSFNREAPPSFNRGAPPSFNRGAPPPSFNRGAPPPSFNRGAPPGGGGFHPPAVSRPASRAAAPRMSGGSRGGGFHGGGGHHR